jgi:hypothetical protein
MMPTGKAELFNIEITPANNELKLCVVLYSDVINIRDGSVRKPEIVTISKM